MTRLLPVASLLFVIVSATGYAAAQQTAGAETRMKDQKTSVTYDRGCIVRGPRDQRRIALEFTGGEYADGADTILQVLKDRKVKASFFFIGDFFRTPAFKPLIERIRDEGHYLGPHSDKHPLYASWESPPRLQITRAAFDADLQANMRELEQFGISKSQARYFIPPYEHFTPEISKWTAAQDMVLVNYTTGTRTHADYMEDDHPRFLGAREMVQSVYQMEQKDPDGLNGWMLLMHIGAGPRRTREHLYSKLGEMLDELSSRGYSFVRIDELLKDQ